MAKLEEISELLVSEIEQFDSAVNKLKQIQQNKIQLDLRELRKMMTEYRQDLEKVSREQQRHLERLDYFSQKIQRTLNRSIWAVYLGIIINVITIVLLLGFVF